MRAFYLQITRCIVANTWLNTVASKIDVTSKGVYLPQS